MPDGAFGSAFGLCAGMVISGTINAFIGYTVGSISIKNGVLRNVCLKGFVNRFWFPCIRIRSGLPIS